MLVTVLLAAGLVLILDQASKALVVRRLAPGQATSALFGSPVRIRRLSNARPGLGLVRGRRSLLLVWGCVMVLLAMVALARAGAEPIAQIGLGTAVGGAAGNVLDRFGRGAVVDFIDLRIWPLFNLADVAIVGGAMLAAWGLR